jgi:hypothetical protein
MIKIVVDEKCPVCSGELKAKILIDERHYESTGEAISRSPYCAEPVWAHLGFECDGCIRISCRTCGAQASLDIGSMEFLCTGPQPEDDRVPSWCPGILGEMKQE